MPDRIFLDVVHQLLATQFSSDIDDLQPLKGGEVSQVFSFSAGGERYVVRFAHPVMLDAFEKESMIGRRVSVRVPEIVRMGRTQEHSYAVSPFCPGTPVNQLEDPGSVTPSLIRTLDAIHQTDLRGWRAGYGHFDGRGVGRAPTWRDHLVKVGEQEPGGFFGLWHRLFTDSFLEKDVFDDVHQRMLSLLPTVPERRFLVHGDYGFDNVLAQDDEITAVLDWANALYGDFLYDVARLRFFDLKRDYAELFREHYASQDRVPEDYDERLRCYLCYIGLDAMRLYAHTNQPHPYNWAKERTLYLTS